MLPAPRRGATALTQEIDLVATPERARHGAEDAAAAVTLVRRRGAARGRRAERVRRASSSTASSTTSPTRYLDVARRGLRARSTSSRTSIDDLASRAEVGAGSPSSGTSSSIAGARSSATRAAVRRVLDGRDRGRRARALPAGRRASVRETRTRRSCARRRSSTSPATCSRACATTISRRSSENQNEVGKKLTVIASLVLVPSLIVGFYGQNFECAFDDGFWTIGVSTGLIVVSTLIQLAIFRWRRWI